MTTATTDIQFFFLLLSSSLFVECCFLMESLVCRLVNNWCHLKLLFLMMWLTSRCLSSRKLDWETRVEARMIKETRQPGSRIKRKLFQLRGEKTTRREKNKKNLIFRITSNCRFEIWRINWDNALWDCVWEEIAVKMIVNNWFQCNRIVVRIVRVEWKEKI